MAAVKKTLAQQIIDAEARLEKLKSMAKGGLLSKDSAGMPQLLAAVELVCKENKCKTVDVIKAISNLKKQGLKIEAAPRSPRKKATSS